MELIKKTILLATTTGTTSDCNGTCRIIVPDLTVDYNMKILLTNEEHNVGFFDAYDVVEGMTGTTLTNEYYVVTGECVSRLDELRKYNITEIFSNQYVGNGSAINNGVDYNNSVQNELIIYYIDGIEYSDKILNGITTTIFSFMSNGLSSINFTNKPIYQNPNKEKIISNPKIDNDVFIIRQELSAFEGNYRLEYVERLVDIETYASGKYFNIVNNS